MNKYRISAVSYLNTIPFIYGLKNHEILDQIELTLDNPSVCAEKLIKDKADIGLVPVAILPQIGYNNIISDFCIGSVGKVKSVILYSNTKINQINTIMLDYQSRTSVLLAKILAKNYWNIEVNWINASPGYEKTPLSEKQAGVVIGDRSFRMSKNYKYCFDLSEQWYLFTGLPFVFATWTSNKHIESNFLSKFNKALQYGVNNMMKAVNEIPDNSALEKPELFEYLSNDISYILDDKKRKGLDLFLNLVNDLK